MNFKPARSSRERIQKTAQCFIGLLAMLLLGGIKTPARAAEFAVQYLDNAGEGFKDPKIGAARRAAFEAALSYWSVKLGPSPVVIGVGAYFSPLGGGYDFAPFAEIQSYGTYIASPVA